jgi:predicted methyltransferase
LYVSAPRFQKRTSWQRRPLKGKWVRVAAVRIEGQAMRTFDLFRPLAMLALAAGCSGAPVADNATGALDAAIAGPHRTAAFKARDRYRHPRETLAFFGFRPDMHVVEVWPGAGWYAEILGPALRERGRYYAAHYPVDGGSPANWRSSRQAFLDRLSKQPALYDRTVVTSLHAPARIDMAPKGTVDLVLTFRNVHNWATDYGNDEAMFRAFYEALKPGGVLGVVEHRAREGTSLEDMKRSGYMTESYVMGLARKAGFRLAARSEVNANPKDTKDHRAGVWTLPPTLRLGGEDREKYLAIGESDRMTLKFVKP